jgi:hypothetical protein
MEVGTSSYITEDFELLRDFSKVVWLTEDEGTSTIISITS